MNDTLLDPSKLLHYSLMPYYKATLTILLMLAVTTSWGQRSIHTAGGTATGSGSVTYSIGQVTYMHHVSPDGQVSQGVQHQVTWSLPTSLPSQSTRQSAEVWPNPASDYLNVTGQGKVMIFDVTGRIVSTHPMGYIDITGLRPGVYLLMANDRSLPFTKN